MEDNVIDNLVTRYGLPDTVRELLADVPVDAAESQAKALANILGTSGGPVVPEEGTSPADRPNDDNHEALSWLIGNLEADAYRNGTTYKHP